MLNLVDTFHLGLFACILAVILGCFSVIITIIPAIFILNPKKKPWFLYVISVYLWKTISIFFSLATLTALLAGFIFMGAPWGGIWNLPFFKPFFIVWIAAMIGAVIFNFFYKKTNDMLIELPKINEDATRSLLFFLPTLLLSGIYTGAMFAILLVRAFNH